MDAGFETALHQVNSEAPAAAKKTPEQGGKHNVDLSHETQESLSAKSVHELKEIAKGAHVSIAECVEKSEIVNKLLACHQTQ